MGNSSSGFIEAPFLKIPVVNIGNRQDGRPLVSNIVQTNLEKKNILRAIKKIYNPDFRRKLKHTRTFYYKKNTTENIIKVLRNINLINIKIKKFKYEKP